MNDANTFNHFPPEIISPMLAQLTSDLAERLDCKWAIAIDGIGSGLVPLYTFGRNPNLQTCLAQTNTVLSGQLSGIDLHSVLVNLQQSRCEEWTPRVLCLVRARGRIVGILALGPRNTEESYSKDDQDLVRTHVANFSFLLSDEGLTAKIGTEIARSRRTRIEFESARQVQQRFLPCKLTSIDGLDYYGESQPLGEVGGDFFDFIPVGESSLLLSIGDVSGKGVASAIIMAAVQGSLRALESCMDFKICKLMHNLNRMVWQLAPDNFFATMFCARVDVATREMQYVNAGHDRAILFRADKKRAITLKTTGGVLGLSTRTVFERRTIRFEAGDTLVVVTDGITEAADMGGNGFDRTILNGMHERANESARDLAEYIMRVAQRHSEDAEAPPDDKSVIVVRRMPDAAEAFIPVPIRPRMLAHAVGF